MKKQMNDLQLDKNEMDKTLKETEKTCDKKINGLINVKFDKFQQEEHKNYSAEPT